MKISIKITVEDNIEFLKNYINGDKSYKNRNNKIIIKTIFVALITMYIIYTQFNINKYLILLYIALIPLIIYIDIYRLRNYYLKSLEDEYIKKENSGFIGKKIFDFNEKNFIVKDNNNEYIIMWSSIIKIKETEKYFFIYITGISGYSLSKSKVKDKKVLKFIKNKSKEITLKNKIG